MSSEAIGIPVRWVAVWEGKELKCLVSQSQPPSDKEFRSSIPVCVDASDLTQPAFTVALCWAAM